ncbi:hypothetical protein ACN081_01640 [Rothia sp. P13129]|uniref:hypothetical protein n=1 Tax=Rothia sp. P13129 TaxID=3402664 RepID=UPI003AD0BEB6
MVKQQSKEPPTSTDQPTPPTSITRKESSAILGASVLSALSAFLATVIAKHALPSADVPEFLVFWALLFGIYGIIGGIASEATRAVGAAQLNPPATPGARPAVIALGIGLGIAIIVTATSGIWIHYFLSQDPQFTLVAIALATVLYAVQVALSGNAAGEKKWYLMATINGGEATWRFVSMLVVGLLAGYLWGLEAAVISPALLWIVLAICSSHARSALGARGDVPAKTLTINTLIAMGSAGASAALTTGFPLMMKATEGASSGTHSDMVLGALILAISITRSPIMIPLQAFQGVAISLFIKHQDRPLQAIVRPAGALLGVGAIGAIAAYLIGPFLFLAIYHPKPEETVAYQEVAQGHILALLTFASAIMALLVLSGTLVLATNLHRIYILGWVGAACISLGLLFLPLPLMVRVLISLFVGPLSGFSIHLIGAWLNARVSR